MIVRPVTVSVGSDKSPFWKEKATRPKNSPQARELLRFGRDTGEHMNPQEMFVTRLRRHRTRSRVPIEEIATTLRIRPELIEGLENNDLTGWPRGLYSRAWIRAYALAVDLDPIDTVDEFCRLFPQGDPGDCLHRRLVVWLSRRVQSRAGPAQHR